jgi:hypothetical protein
VELPLHERGEKGEEREKREGMRGKTEKGRGKDKAATGRSSIAIFFSVGSR